MSRHVIEENPVRQVVVGYDRPLRQMFGQVYGEARNGKNRRGPMKGWPTGTGLGIKPPLATEPQVRAALMLLCGWMRGHGVSPATVERMYGVLLLEWQEDVA